MKKYVTIFAFLCIALWFVAVQPWGRIVDPDAYYHSTMAKLMLEQGNIREFPWLDLTSFAHPFVNQHWLFHVLLVPFVWLFGAFLGGQIAATCFALLFSIVMYQALKKLQTSYPLFWTVILVTMPAIASRLTFGKASPIAMALFVIGCTTFLLQRYWLSFFVMMGYVLTHAGWPLLILTQGALFVGFLLYEFLDRKNTQAPRLTIYDKRLTSYAKPFITTLLGAVVGIFLHPYREHLFGFLRVQIGSIGISTPTDRVLMGSEWYPPSTTLFLFWMIPFVLAFCVGIYALLQQSQTSSSQRQEVYVRYAVMLSIPMAFLGALTLKSARFIEYFAIILAFFFACIYSFIEFSTLKRLWSELGYTLRHAAVPAFLLLYAAYPIMVARDLWRSSLPYVPFPQAQEKIQELMKPGERLFTSDWGVMPGLWASNQDIRFVSGLDPTFLLVQHPELSDRVMALTTGKATSTAYDVIANETQSSYVFVNRLRLRGFESALKSDKRFELVFEDEKSALYKVR